MKVASNDELVEIANIITDNGKGRISLATEHLQEIETALEQGIMLFGIITQATKMTTSPIASAILIPLQVF